MERYRQLESEVEALRKRLSRLSEASIRINESLDLEEVLQGVLDSARSLTGARYGAMTAVDDSGQLDNLLSSGLTADQTADLWSIRDGAEVFEILGSIQEPTRLRDFQGYVKSMGGFELCLPMPVRPQTALLMAPIRHHGECMGSIYLVEKEEGWEFTDADEETLVMFASQAAMVIVNARRHRDEQHLRRDLETLVDTAPVGVIVLPAGEGDPMKMNHEARRIAGRLHQPGHSAEELIGRAIVRRADGREFRSDRHSLTEMLMAGEVVRAEEVVIKTPEGRSIAVLVNATPIRSDRGEVEGAVVILQDMTPLQELERLRAEFLGMVSHELRTPLTSIKGSVMTLLDTATPLNPAETRQFHRIINAQADRMRTLITDLLDVAHIETGSLSVDPEPSDVRTLIDEARNIFLSGGTRHDINVNLPADLPLVMADRQRIVQVLSNLLSNASRYSPDFYPIRMSAVAGDLSVTVSVADEGYGLPQEQLPFLFKKFSRIDGGEDVRDDRGAGLGLAICKGIVEAHGGRIWAESEGPGEGARFTFTIPVAEPTDSGVVQAPHQNHAHSGPRNDREARVLVVDDDPQTLRHVRDILSKDGHTAVTACDGEEALRFVGREHFDLALLDLVMPGFDGIELMRRIHEIVDVPVIFLSAYGRDDNIERAFEIGATDYVLKPFSPTELAARVKATLRSRTTLQEDEASGGFSLGDLTIDYAQREVRVAARPVHLTPIEFSILRLLSINAGRVLTHDQVLRRVWGGAGPHDQQVLRTHLRRLRRKLGDSAESPNYIFTEPRVGYRMPKP